VLQEPASKDELKESIIEPPIVEKPKLIKLSTVEPMSQTARLRNFNALKEKLLGTEVKKTLL
jgi:hypothetical protein